MLLKRNTLKGRSTQDVIALGAQHIEGTSFSVQGFFEWDYVRILLF